MRSISHILIIQIFLCSSATYASSLQEEIENKLQQSKPASEELETNIDVDSSEKGKKSEGIDIIKSIGSGITRTTFYAACSSLGTWIGSGKVLRILNELGKQQENYSRASTSKVSRIKLFLDYKDSWSKVGGYVGAFIGTSIAIGIIEYGLPASGHIINSIRRVAFSIWDWDSSKSSRRDKVVTTFTRDFKISVWSGWHCTYYF